MGIQGRRAFSSEAGSTEEIVQAASSIFDSAEFNANESVTSTFSSSEPLLPFFDSNDTLSSIASSLPKDVGNIADGVPTYGIFEHLTYLDSVFYNGWM